MGKKTTAKKTPSTSFNPTFVSPAAEEKYEQSLDSLTLVPEKGFVLQDSPTMGFPPMVHAIIQRLQWKKFCAQPEEAIVPLVREFCANYKEEDIDVVEVRGVQVECHPAAINDFYELEYVEDEFYPLLESLNEQLLEEIMEKLCIPGTQWTISAQGAHTFPRNNLKPEAKVWYHFLKSRLLPTTHIQTVSQERAALLFCILEGRNIDVGNVIFEEMKLCIQRTSGNMWFPCLISGLCQAQGVAYNENEEHLKMAIPITAQTVARIAQEKGRKGQNDAEAGPSSNQPASAGISNATALLDKRVAQLEKSQGAILAELHHFTSNQREMWKYIQARDATLAKNLKASSKKFFTFPNFPEHVLAPPPPLEQDDEKEAD